jgi:hypothetical protein
MMREDPITYEELPAEYTQKYDEIKALFEADLIGSFEKTRHHVLGGRGSHLKALLMTWTYPPLFRRSYQSSTPRGQLHGGPLTTSALREPGERF